MFFIFYLILTIDNLHAHSSMGEENNFAHQEQLHIIVIIFDYLPSDIIFSFYLLQLS